MFYGFTENALHSRQCLADNVPCHWNSFGPVKDHSYYNTFGCHPCHIGSSTVSKNGSILLCTALVAKKAKIVLKTINNKREQNM